MFRIITCRCRGGLITWPAFNLSFFRCLGLPGPIIVVVVIVLVVRRVYFLRKQATQQNRLSVLLKQQTIKLSVCCNLTESCKSLQLRNVKQHWGIKESLHSLANRKKSLDAENNIPLQNICYRNFFFSKKIVIENYIHYTEKLLSSIFSIQKKSYRQFF